MSILHVDLKIPGGTYKHEPLFRTTTFVGYVPSKPSSALWAERRDMLISEKTSQNSFYPQTELSRKKICFHLFIDPFFTLSQHERGRNENFNKFSLQYHLVNRRLAVTRSEMKLQLSKVIILFAYGENHNTNDKTKLFFMYRQSRLKSQLDPFVKARELTPRKLFLNKKTTTPTYCTSRRRVSKFGAAEFANPLRRRTLMNSILNSCRSIPGGKCKRKNSQSSLITLSEECLLRLWRGLFTSVTRGVKKGDRMSKD